MQMAFYADLTRFYLHGDFNQFHISNLINYEIADFLLEFLITPDQDHTHGVLMSNVGTVRLTNHRQDHILALLMVFSLQ